ncbi:MAG: alkene reductase [Deltaproteobacteria bacterium]|nr:alkene reductase [Deltaproteobacteria bacterium]
MSTSRPQAPSRPQALFEPIQLGRLELRNRIVMAPMTRSRAGSGDEPTDLMVEYYRQRASAGLIVSEGIFPTADGKGYCRTPGLVSKAHVDGWRQVVDAVHNEGGRVVAQIMHCGRIAHVDNKHPDSQTVAPSAIRAKGDMFTDSKGMQPFSKPRALRLDEIPGVIGEFARATELAYDAGFDGVELHCASGYLPAQFLSTGTNERYDEYGGSLANRIRFPVELLDAMAGVDGAERVGFRICPNNPFNDLSDEDAEETFEAFLGAARDRITGDLAYCHVIRLHEVDLDNLELARKAYGGPLIVNDSYKLPEAQEVVGSGSAAAVSFGRSFIGNPDLVRRFREGAEISRFDVHKLYSPGPEGYTDYPTLDD